LSFSSRFTGFSSNPLVNIPNTFSIIGLRWTQRSNFSGNLANQFLIYSRYNNHRVFLLFRIYFDIHIIRSYKVNWMRKTKGHLQNTVAYRSTVSYSPYFQLFAITFRNTLNHITNQRAVKAMQRALKFFIRASGNG